MDAPKSTRFEKLVARIQHDLSPGAQVTHNEKIRGRKSNTPRQIDVTVRTQVGQFPLLIAIECKDLSRPANIKHVEAFAGLLEDIGANKGAIVSARGFSEAAKRRAYQAGIDVYRLVDVEDHDWKAYATIPILFHDTILVKAYFRLHFSYPPEPGFEADDPEKVEICDSDGKSLGCPIDILRRCWNDGDLTYSQVTFKTFHSSKGRFCSSSIDAKSTPLTYERRCGLRSARILVASRSMKSVVSETRSVAA